MKEAKKEVDQAKGLLKELIEQFGVDDVTAAAVEHGIVVNESGGLLGSGVLDDDDDIPEGRRISPCDDFVFEPAYDSEDLYKFIINGSAVKQNLQLESTEFNPCVFLPLFMPPGLKKVKGGVEGMVDVTAIGTRKDGCRYVKIDLGGKQKITVKKKELTVGPEVTVILCKTDAAKAQSDVFKNAFDLTKLREMGGTTKPGGAAAKVQVTLGWKKGNNPVRDSAKPNVWRAPDLVEKS